VLTARPASVRLVVVDAVVAAVIFLAWTWVIAHSDESTAWSDYALAAASTLPAALRRLWPLPAFAVGALGVLGALLVGPVPGTTAVALAFILYTVVAGEPPRTVVAVTGVAIGLVLLAFARTPGTNAQSLTLDLLFLAVVLVAGRGALARRENVRLLEERAHRLERDREAHAERAVAEERAAIARELHDVVGHAMSQISVQAGMGRLLGPGEPEKAVSSLAAIETVSREALGEMRRLTSALRLPDDELEPARRLSDLDALVATMASSGVTVTLDRLGSVRPLSAGVELAAYRIVQESLTNVATHAGPTAARVRLEYAEDELVVSVDDDGGTAAAEAGTGFGLLGMAERAKALGGRFEAGPRGRGFAVTARLPTGEQ
jgi:signal transduction histidine kinase